MTIVYWGCAESYPGSGRPSRVWAEATDGIRPDEGEPYPFNGMGGEVITGPFNTPLEAVGSVLDMIETAENGMLYWK